MRECVEIVCLYAGFGWHQRIASNAYNRQDNLMLIYRNQSPNIYSTYSEDLITSPRSPQQQYRFRECGTHTNKNTHTHTPNHKITYQMRSDIFIVHWTQR